MAPVTRLAPSPTGHLHLGNAWSFLLAWLAARSRNGKVILRMDDIDPQRSRDEFADSIIDDLAWIGLTWDGPVVRQSARTDHYRNAFDQLEAAGLIYPCFCNRRELRSLAQAPHIGDEGVTYPGTCRNIPQEERTQRIRIGGSFSWRLACPEEPVAFYDGIRGEQNFTKRQYGGDFPIKRSDGIWSYQLASVVDDAACGVSLVLRGRDLLPSTPRQIVLSELLGFTQPEYLHIPLLLDKDGERLAKRHRSMALGELRRNGVTPERIIGYLAFLAGMNPAAKPRSPADLAGAFRPDMIPRNDLICDPDCLY